MAVEGDMSFTAGHISKGNRRACEACRERKARFRYRGTVKADRDHTLCFECYRRERERQRARGLVDLAQRPAVTASNDGFRGPTVSLTQRQVTHRRAMLAAMTAQSGASARCR
jgi:hypothetical protein